MVFMVKKDFYRPVRAYGSPEEADRDLRCSHPWVWEKVVEAMERLLVGTKVYLEKSLRRRRQNLLTLST